MSAVRRVLTANSGSSHNGSSDEIESGCVSLRIVHQSAHQQSVEQAEQETERQHLRRHHFHQQQHRHQQQYPLRQLYHSPHHHQQQDQNNIDYYYQIEQQQKQKQRDGNNTDTYNDVTSQPLCRARAQSMHGHSSLLDRREKHGRRNARRKSLPSGERLLPAADQRNLIDNFLAVPTVQHSMDDASSDEQQQEAEPASVRRARSFRERKSRNGEPLRRVRSFKTTSKGLVNRGDSFKTKKNTVYSGSTVNPSDNKVTDEPEVIQKLDIPTLDPVSIVDHTNYFFRVMMIGASGVGKTSLIDQFMTSDFLGSGEFSISQSEDERSVTVQVDGDESTLEFVRSNNMEDITDYCSSIDGYIVVYSICDRSSFDSASRLLVRLREEIGHHKAVILAANKSDIVRKRIINTEDGREVADSHGCKYIETSAALNHKVDELLVGMLKQILLKMQDAASSTSNGKTDHTVEKTLKRRKSSSFKRTKQFLEKLFRGNSGKDKTTENLYV